MEYFKEYFKEYFTSLKGVPISGVAFVRSSTCMLAVMHACYM